MSRIVRTLVAAGAAAGLGAFGLVTAANPAAASTGTTGGSWYLDLGDGNNAIATTTSPPATSYQATVQQPINADGSSVFSAKSRTIPLKYSVQKCTTPGSSTTVYPDTLESLSGVPVGTLGSYGALDLTPTSGTTVAGITSLTANFTWLHGYDHTGSMRWSIVTPAGNIYVYYGDASTQFQSGNGGSGADMTSTGDARVETPASGPGHYVTWGDMQSQYGSDTVSDIILVVDWTGGDTQQVQLTGDPAVTVGLTSGAATYTPGTVATGGGSTTCVTSNSDPAWVYLNEVSGSTPGQVVDENLVSAQGDSGGQFRQVDGMYIYNFPVSNLPDKTATYQFGIMIGGSTATPAGVVAFGLK